MNSICFKIIFLLAMSLAMPTSAGVIFVGNGGEGVFSKGIFTLRDLYEYDIELFPHFGIRTSSSAKEILKEWNPLQLSPKQKYLLLRKLNDINGIVPQLGDQFARSLISFNWVFTDKYLYPYEEDDDLTEVKRYHRVMIALRVNNEITVNHDTFRRLNDENKVALLIHEMVYANLERNKVENSKFRHLRMVRFLTAQLFLTPLQQRRIPLADLLKEELIIP